MKFFLIVSLMGFLLIAKKYLLRVLMQRNSYMEQVYTRRYKQERMIS